MKSSTLFCAAALLVAATGPSALAQSVGQSKIATLYNLHQATSAQQYAQSQARALYYYGQTMQPTPAQAKEHATAVREGIAKSQKSLAELKKTNPDNKEAQDAIAKIEAIQKKVLGHCDMMDKALASADHVEMCSCCADIANEIEAANAEMTRLQKALKIDSTAALKPLK